MTQREIDQSMEEMIKKYYPESTQARSIRQRDASHEAASITDLHRFVGMLKSEVEFTRAKSTERIDALWKIVFDQGSTIRALNRRIAALENRGSR